MSGEAYLRLSGSASSANSRSMTLASTAGGEPPTGVAFVPNSDLTLIMPFPTVYEPVSIFVLAWFQTMTGRLVSVIAHDITPARPAR
jgi:hypothetical protein